MSKKNIAVLSTVMLTSAALLGAKATAVHADAVAPTEPNTPQNTPSTADAIISAKQTVQKATGDNTVAQDKVNQAHATADASKQNADQLHNTSNSAQSKLSDAQKNLSTAQKNANQATPAAIDQAKTAVADQKSTNTNTQNQVNNDKGQVNAAEETLNDGQNKLDNAKQSATTASNQVNAAQKKVNAATSTSTGTDVVDANAKLSQSKQNQATTQKNETAAQKAAVDANKSVVAAQKTVDSANNSVNAANKKQSDAKTEQKQANDANNAASKTVNDAQAALDSAKANSATPSYSSSIKLSSKWLDTFNKALASTGTVRDAAIKEAQTLSNAELTENVFDGTGLSTSPQYRLDNLPEDELTKLNDYFAKLLNDIRVRLGTRSTIYVNKNDIDFAKDVANRYGDFIGTNGHDIPAINAAAAARGLIQNPSGNMYENLTESMVTATPNALYSESTLYGIIFNATLNFVISDAYSNFGHATTLLNNFANIGFAFSTAKTDGSTIGLQSGSYYVTQMHVLSVQDQSLLPVADQNKFESIYGISSSATIKPDEEQATAQINYNNSLDAVALLSVEDYPTLIQHSEKNVTDAQNTLKDAQNAYQKNPSSTNKSNLDGAKEVLDMMQSALQNEKNDSVKHDKDLSAAKGQLAKAKVILDRANTPKADTKVADAQRKLSAAKSAQQTTQAKLAIANKALSDAQTVAKAAANTASMAQSNLKNAQQQQNVATDSLNKAQSVQAAAAKAVNDAQMALKTATDNANVDTEAKQQAVSAAQTELVNAKKNEAAKQSALKAAQITVDQATNILTAAKTKLANDEQKLAAGQDAVTDKLNHLSMLENSIIALKTAKKQVANAQLDADSAVKQFESASTTAATDWATYLKLLNAAKAMQATLSDAQEKLNKLLEFNVVRKGEDSHKVVLTAAKPLAIDNQSVVLENVKSEQPVDQKPVLKAVKPVVINKYVKLHSTNAKQSESTLPQTDMEANDGLSIIGLAIMSMIGIFGLATRNRHSSKHIKY